MEDISSRIKELIQSLAITNKDFAAEIDVAPAIISHVLSGRNNPSLNLIQQITNVYTNVNLDYLLNGRGSLFMEPQNAKGSPEPSPSPVIQAPNEGVSGQDHNLPPGARKVPVPSGAPIPNKVDDIQEEPTKNYDQTESKSKTLESEYTNVYTNVNRENNKKIERIVIFYSDQSFREYHPEA